MSDPTSTTSRPWDAVIIGAGVSGIYQLHRLLGLGLRVVVLEAGDDAGGTWYWNRYPGARFDSESYSYQYSWCPDVLAEWNWSEHFAAQPETLRYLHHVIERYDLRHHMVFGVQVTEADWDDAGAYWTVRTAAGDAWRGRFLISALGALSIPTSPRFEGMDTFAGPSFHTARWPHEPLDLTGLRVGVVGTGASGVQVIQEVAKVAGHLTVFQRRPNWCAPLHNSRIADDEQVAIKAGYAEVFDRCSRTGMGFVHQFDRRSALEVPEDERLAFWEARYAEPGFGIWLGNFKDVLSDPAANAAMSAFVAGKIRDRVRDPATAEKLIPTDHGFGTRRVPLETGYYEVYNQPNVTLVDLPTDPVVRVTPGGIETASGHHDLDVLVYATGFDAITGALDRISFTGRDGVTLRDAWADGPSTFLGVATPGFPNLLVVVGPRGGSTSSNLPRGIEHNVEFVTDLIAETLRRGSRTVEADPDATAAWTAHCIETSQGLLLTTVRSWFMGINTNVDGLDKPRYLLYSGGLPAFRRRCDEVVANGYEGFSMR